MTRGILVVGNDSFLFRAAAAETAKRVETFAAAVIPHRLVLPDGSGAGAAGDAAAGSGEITGPLQGAIPLSWNPSSAVSARSLVLAAENRLTKINDAVLVCSPPALFKTAEALRPGEVEILVNDHIKGWFFLIRELVLYFRRSGTGLLAFVTPDMEKIPGSDGEGRNRKTTNKLSQVDFFSFTAGSAFRAYCQGIIAASLGESWQAMGFSGCEAGAEEEFVSWLYKFVDEASHKNAGRWHRYSRRGFFR